MNMTRILSIIPAPTNMYIESPNGDGSVFRNPILCLALVEDSEYPDDPDVVPMVYVGDGPYLTLCTDIPDCTEIFIED